MRFNFRFRLKGKEYKLVYFQEDHNYNFIYQGRTIVKEKDLQKAYSELERKLIKIDPPKERGSHLYSRRN